MSDQLLLERMVKALETMTKQGGGMHTKAPANNHTGQLLTQPGGLFTVPGMERDLFSLHVRPAGLGAVLPAYPSRTDDPRFGFITGFSDDIGSEPATPCADAPTGYMKGGTLTAAFGFIKRGTETINPPVLLHQSRTASTNLRLLNDMMAGGNGMAMDMPADPIRTVVDTEMVGVGVRLERKNANIFWQGVTTNNNAGGGYKEYPGLDYQIATGQVDAESNTAMPSADSLIYDFNYNLVGGNVLDIVEYLSSMEFYLRDTARRTGVLPVQWVVVMRPELWEELSAVWPCRYQTNRCENFGGTNPLVINDNANIAMRDAMRNEMYIPINGTRYPVITDDAIYEHTNITNGNVPAGHYASSIYFVPLRAIGNYPVLYWEYIDYNGIDAQLAGLGAGLRNTPFWPHSGGRFLWVYKTNGACFTLEAQIEPRVVLRTPHLAGKIQNILYAPMKHLRSFDPDSPYHLNGGVSLRSVGTSYHVWS